jgi:ABC-type uncharacterized transport system involved in gliding motility auxiliary subunit
LGLWLSLVASLVSIGLYIVQREWNLALQISLGLIVIGLALFALLDPQRVRIALTGRQARYGSNVFVLSLAFLGILVVVNYLAYDNPKKWDLTEDKENTLAPETLDVLAKLPEPVTARAFFSPNTSSESAQALLDQYVYNGQDKFNYEVIDPIQNPAAAKDANVTIDGTIVLYMGDLKEPVGSVTEQELTGALVRLMNPGGRIIYFLTGHGEFPIDGSGDNTYTQLKSRLEAKNYSVNSLNLLATPQIPDDATAIVVAGPQKPLSEEEVTLLDGYLKNGGGLIVMEEPIINTQFGSDPDPLADYLAQNWGVVLGNDIVADLKTQQLYLAIANEYGNHAITQKMGNIATVFPVARSVDVTNAIDSGVSQTKLILTAAESWAETNMDSVINGNLAPDDGVDQFGPISLAVAAENFNTNGRLVVFGDAEFALNAYIDAYGNSDMMINSVDWAAGQENLINLTPKQTTERVMATPKTYTIGLLFLGSMIILPGIILASGIVAWIVRRRRG